MRIQLNNNNYSDVVTPIIQPGFTYDADLNDSDKTFTVPTGEMWRLLYANATLITTATVGNRQVRMEVSDPSGNPMGYISSGAVQAASLTRHYGFMQGIYRETSFIDGMIQIPIPVDLFLPAGATIRFYDSAAVDAAADDLTVAFGYAKYKGM
jgi:hypothetical protein